MKKLRLAALLALPLALGLYLNSAMSWRPRTLASFREPVLSVSWSPDGKRLASAGGDGNVAVWDAGSMRLERTLSAGSGELSGVAFSPDGKWVAASLNNGIKSDRWGAVRLFDARSGALKQSWIGQRGVSAVAFSGDSRTLASSGSEGVTARDLISGKVHGSFYVGEAFPVQRLAMSHDGTTTIGLCEATEVAWWDLRKVQRKGYAGEGVDIQGTCAAFSPDGKTLAVGTRGYVNLYDVQSRKPCGSFVRHNGEINAIAFSPDGNTVASGGEDGRIELWDVPSPKPLRELKGHDKAITSLAFAPDGNTLASSSADGTVRLWRLR